MLRMITSTASGEDRLERMFQPVVSRCSRLPLISPFSKGVRGISQNYSPFSKGGYRGLHSGEIAPPQKAKVNEREEQS